MDSFNLPEKLLDDQKEIEINIINDAIEKSKTDPGAMYEPAILEVLQEVLQS